jgi:nucleoside-diphosphate-sugar epimerase
VVGKDDYLQWSVEDRSELVLKYIDSFQTKPSIIINAVGIVNPSTPEAEILGLNYHLPVNLIGAAEKSAIKVVTFGSIMENFPNSSQDNNYLKSKLKLKEFLTDNALGLSQALHFQVHTFYGGVRLHKHMFLGQIYDAIKDKKTFRMSSGNQVREYHHVQDDARAIKHLIDLDLKGIHALNHGQTYALKDIAEFIFDSFDFTDLLQIGMLTNPTNDNFTTGFRRPNTLDGLSFRDSLPSIVSYLRQLGL